MIAIKLYKDNPHGIPAEWPMEVRESVETLPDNFDLLLEDRAAYEDYLSRHRAIYEAWAHPQSPPPPHDAATQWPAEWRDGRWVIVDKTWQEVARDRNAKYPPVENYQVRAWMIRGGLDPETVPQIIAAVVPESVPGGINRAESLMRWEYAVKVPRDFALVDVIGAQMGLTPAEIDEAWPVIALL